MKFFAKHLLAAAVITAGPAALAMPVEEIVITASPFAKTAEAVNKPVNLLSGDDLRSAAAATLGETLDGQLGVSSASFGPGVGLPIIRGQSDNRVKVMQNSVGTMDASAASPDHAVAVEPLLASKIEVLRGPAALRYGGGAIGGVVNVLDKRIPEQLPDTLEGGMELRHASVNDETAGVATLNTAVGNIALHIDGIKRASNALDIPGYAAKNPTSFDDTTKHYIANSDAKSESGTLGASYIGDEGFIGASVNRLDNNYGVPPDGEELVRIDMQQTRYDVKGELNAPMAGFEKLSAHIGHNIYQHIEMEGAEEGTKFSNDAYEARLELIHSPLQLFALQWQGALGLQAAQSDFAAIGDEAFIPRSDIDTLGVFILEETHHNDWHYELGLRQDLQKIAPDSAHSISHNSTNLSASATWHFTEQQQISFGLAQSQRSPSIEELFAEGPHPATGSYLIGDQDLNEETSTNLELGYHWHNEELQVSANIFYNQIKDFIYAQNLNQIYEELRGYQYTQADATFKGFETEIKIPFKQYWNLRVFSDSVRATLDEGGIDGRDLPRITPMRIGGALEFNLKQWSATISNTYSAKQDHPGLNEAETASYQRLDMRVDYRFNKNATDYTLYLKASNLLDREIRNASSYLRDIAPEAGRNLQAGIRVTF